MQHAFPRPRCLWFAVALLLAAPSQAAPVDDLAAGFDARSITASARDTAAATVKKVWWGAQDVAVFALGMLGVDYRFGGETPEEGVDCSGLVRYVFRQVTGVTLPRTAKDMARIGEKVSPAELKPGDLVFFNTRRFAFSHVGLYLGDGRFIHAPRTGSEVAIARLTEGYWQRQFNGARRLVGVLPALVPTVIGRAEAKALPDPDAEPADVDLSPPR